MQKFIDNNRRVLKIVLPSLGAFAIVGMLLPSQKVAAADEASKKVQVYTLDSDDPYVADTLKAKVILQLAQDDSSIDLSTVDMANSQVSVSGLNMSRPGIQSVSVHAGIVKFDDEAKTLGYSVTENAVINVIKSSAPKLKLKKTSVVVNNGDVWNASSYISMVSDDSGTLPLLKEVDNVNMSVDGDYYASYTAVDSEGNSTSAILNVTVKTPQEILDAQAAAAEAEAEAAEATRQAQAAEAARQASIAKAAALAAIDTSKLGNYAGGINTALSMVGVVPYVWGGTSPSSGFDCSGLVAYCYGLSARTAAAQSTLGAHRYDISNAPAGALYFYGSEGNPYHVSISLGNGSAVQALNPSDGISVVSNSVFTPSYYIVIGQ